MLKLPEKLQMVMEHLTFLPGVGEKTAMRYSLAMLNLPPGQLQTLGECITDLQNMQKCRECGIWADTDICWVCLEPERKVAKSICVVATMADCLAIEKSGEYRGLYHILGGVLNPLAGIGPEDLTIDKLLIRMEQLGLVEAILALSPSVEGDITCSYLKEQLPRNVVANRIGMGVPIGGHLEYLDALTINKALENRRSL